MLKKADIKQRHLFSKIQTEVRILFRLQHPHIMSLFDVINAPENLILVTEYIPGGELYNLIERKGKLDEGHANMIFQQLISALEYCHFNSVVHRDIKPENILLDRHGDVKLADFGLSNLIQEGEFLKTSCGSPNYAPPEVVYGQRYAGPEVDVWSAGVVLFALVAGYLPFDESNMPSLFAKIKSATYQCPFNFSELLKDLISRMLVPDPVERITLSQIKRHPWFNSSCSLACKVLSTKEDIHDEILQNVLTLPEFTDLTTSIREIKSNIRKNKMLPVTVAYRVMLASKINQVMRDGSLIYTDAPLFSNLSEESTAVSSDKSERENLDDTPHDWTYGLKSNAHANKSLYRLLVLLKELGFEWSFVDNYRIVVRALDKRIEFAVEGFTDSDSSVLDIKLLKGNLMENFDTFCKIYRSLYY